MGECLSISIVVYYPDCHLLQKTLQTLLKAATKARLAGLIEDFWLTLVDNAEQPSPPLTTALKQLAEAAGWPAQALAFFAPGNVGYGAGHNLAIQARCEAYHLVLNPDVTLDDEALIECIRYLRATPQVGLITPFCYRPDGQQEYLCKRYPSVWILILRGFAPGFIKACFQKQLAAYDLSAELNSERQDILIASGCFMFFRRQSLIDVKGFDEPFFLYFEDFDLSLRLINKWRIAFVPAVKIVHYGGYSAKKGFRHIMLFGRSAWRFFQRHGWKFR